jgi:hypothetical protein
MLYGDGRLEKTGIIGGVIMAYTNKTSLAFFLPGSRSLSSAEISDLPVEKREAKIASGREGVWIEVLCPDGSCMKKNGKIVLEAVPAGHKEEKGIWLNIFCPGDSCLWKGGTELQ